MPLPVVLMALPPPLNAQPWPIGDPLPLVRCPLAPLLPFASRSSAGCRVTCCRVPLLRQLLPCSRLTHLSSTHLLHSRQLVVPSHLSTPPPPLDMLPPHNWLRVAITNVRMSLLSLRRRLCRRCDCDCHPCRLSSTLSSWRHRPHCCHCR